MVSNRYRSSGDRRQNPFQPSYHPDEFCSRFVLSRPLVLNFMFSSPNPCLYTRLSMRTTCTRGCVLSKTVHTSQREDNVHQRVCPVKDCPHVTAGGQRAPEGVSCQRLSTRHSGRTTCTRGCVLSKTVHTSQREDSVHQRVCPVKDCPHVTA